MNAPLRPANDKPHFTHAVDQQLKLPNDKHTRVGVRMTDSHKQQTKFSDVFRSLGKDVKCIICVNAEGILYISCVNNKQYLTPHLHKVSIFID